jgi:hypothetical protein
VRWLKLGLSMSNTMWPPPAREAWTICMIRGDAEPMRIQKPQRMKAMAVTSGKLKLALVLISGFATGAIAAALLFSGQAHDSLSQKGYENYTLGDATQASLREIWNGPAYGPCSRMRRRDPAPTVGCGGACDG